jgi:hypothetical protein
MSIESIDQLNPSVMKAVEALGYRVTVGDVAAQSGLKLAEAQQGLLALASATQAHMQVAQQGDIAYEFSRDFRAALRNRYWQLQWQETWQKIWQVLFYLIRISFGVVLIASLIIIVIAIFILMIAAQQSNSDRNEDDNNWGNGGSYGGNFPIFIGMDWFRWLDFDYQRNRNRSRGTYGSGKYKSKDATSEKLNFLEAIFSFLFGDGDPNADLDERRWGAIATLIRNQRGVITAEQASPYLDLRPNQASDNEDYMIPVLSRFNGQPQVSPEGEIVYAFPDLQVMAQARGEHQLNPFLKETRRRFTAATSDQVMIAIGIGAFNFVGAVLLGGLLPDLNVSGYIGFVQAIYGFLLGYGTAFLAIPSVRYFWMQRLNQTINQRNQLRQAFADALQEVQAKPAFQQKLKYAQSLSTATVLREEDMVYTTETDLLDQALQQRDQLDEEWQQRLEKGR